VAESFISYIYIYIYILINASNKPHISNKEILNYFVIPFRHELTIIKITRKLRPPLLLINPSLSKEKQ